MISNICAVSGRRGRQGAAAAGSTRETTRGGAQEVLAGGSIYWIIHGQVRVRQLVIGFRSERDDNGRRYCLIEVDAKLVPTLSRSWRPFQGWRYLSPEDAPADRSGDGDPLPDRMLAELRALGLI